MIMFEEVIQMSHFFAIGTQVSFASICDALVQRILHLKYLWLHY